MAARRPTKIQMERLEAKYQLGEYLASGGCGTVMLCNKHGEPNKPYVLKYINLNELTKNKAAGSEREAQLMSKCTFLVGFNHFLTQNSSGSRKYSQTDRRFRVWPETSSNHGVLFWWRFAHID